MGPTYVKGKANGEICEVELLGHNKLITQYTKIQTNKVSNLNQVKHPPNLNYC